jgi:hypothetical protein
VYGLQAADFLQNDPHKNIRTTVGYTHVGYEQTRQTAEALSDALE